MTVVWALLAFLLALDALRVRGRVAAVPVLPPSDEPASPDHGFVLAPGVALDEATRRAASAHARARGLGVLDLVPGDLPALRAWGLFQLLDPAQGREDRLGRGRSAGHAILITDDVRRRAEVPAEPPADGPAFARLAGRLKHYAATTTDVAIAPGLHAVPEDRSRRLAVLREILGSGVAAVLVGVPLILLVLGVGAATNRVTGFLPLAVFQLQPLLAFAGGRLHTRGLALAVLLRAPLDLALWLGLVLEQPPPSEALAAREADAERRRAYAESVAGGLDGFFEPRLDRCPLCGGGDLAAHVRNVDLLQHKPGRFTLDRCRGCGHIFQNPRLSLAGLDFYYRDFYDGLGADDLEHIFGSQATTYLARARAVATAAPAPARWLDVGGGHGHFCCSARQVFPATRFEALDLSESIDEGARRGWVDACYRGLFPDLAPGLAGAYDVVSMSHYLEHTRDPRAEIAAAREALRPGGVLFVEVPDPEFVLGRVLGRLWLPWFQPQHQHLLSCANLKRLMGEAGFEVVLTHRGEAHQRVDFFAAVYLLLDWIAPAVERPWHPPAGFVRRGLRRLVFVLGTPALLAAQGADAIFDPIFRRAGVGNTYRVLARKGEASAAAV